MGTVLVARAFALVAALMAGGMLWLLPWEDTGFWILVVVLTAVLGITIAMPLDHQAIMRAPVSGMVMGAAMGFLFAVGFLMAWATSRFSCNDEGAWGCTDVAPGLVAILTGSGFLLGGLIGWALRGAEYGYKALTGEERQSKPRAR